ncbi:MAG: nucleoside deaminase [Synergistaceae bacterium]|nr:nucleoside deaminase [Synergistaceae bacterium]
MNDIDFMKEALILAKKAFELGEIPIGALIVRDEKIIGRGFNRRSIDASPFAHAEMLAMKDAAENMRSWRFDDCTLYVTLEPCVMCAGAAVQCRMKRIVFGTRDSKAGAVGSLYNIPADKRMYHNCLIKEGILKAECSEILREFFSQKRKNNI